MALEASATDSASAVRKDGVLVLDVGRRRANSLSTSALGLDQLATLFGHELGRAMSPGGLNTGTSIPTEAVESSRRAEGVGLSSEMIVAYQLGLGSTADTDTATAIRESLLTSRAAAQLTVNYSVSPVARTFGI